MTNSVMNSKMISGVMSEIMSELALRRSFRIAEMMSEVISKITPPRLDVELIYVNTEELKLKHCTWFFGCYFM